MGTSPPGVAAQDTPEEIVRHVDELLRGESSRGRVTMEVVTERWTRSLEMEMWSLGEEYSLPSRRDRPRGRQGPPRSSARHPG